MITSPVAAVIIAAIVTTALIYDLYNNGSDSLLCNLWRHATTVAKDVFDEVGDFIGGL